MTVTHAADHLEVVHGDHPDGPAQGQTTDTPAAPATGPGHRAVEPQGTRPDAPPATGSGQESVAAGESSSTRPTFTITEAATACSVSRKTITRKLPELAGHGAAKDDDGVWRIPVEALLAVGLHPGRSLPTTPPAAKRPVTTGPPTPSGPPDRDTVTVSRDRWDDLRIRLARAEAEASERALALADARLALRALTAAPEPQRGAPGTAAGTPGSPPDLGPPAGSPGSAPARPLAPEHTAVPLPGGPGSPAQGTAGAGTAVPGAAPAPPPGGPADPGRQPPTPVPVPPVAVSHGPAATAEPEPTAEVVAARNRAARSGGYVPAAPRAPKKRRWWHAKG